MIDAALHTLLFTVFWDWSIRRSGADKLQIISDCVFVPILFWFSLVATDFDFQVFCEAYFGPFPFLSENENKSVSLIEVVLSLADNLSVGLSLTLAFSHF